MPDDPQVSVAIFCGSDRDFGQSHDHPVAPQLAGISRFRKPHWETVPIKAKITGNYVNACLATQEVMARGYSTPILLDVEGFVTEGGTQSQFFVHQGVLKTAPLARILAGTTRRVVLDVAREAGIPVEEADIRPEELPAMEEAFCSPAASPGCAHPGHRRPGPCRTLPRTDHHTARGAHGPSLRLRAAGVREVPLLSSETETEKHGGTGLPPPRGRREAGRSTGPRPIDFHRRTFSPSARSCGGKGQGLRTGAGESASSIPWTVAHPPPALHARLPEKNVIGASNQEHVAPGSGGARKKKGQEYAPP